MFDNVDGMGRKSKAAITVDLQVEGRIVGYGISHIKDLAQSMLESEVPTKRQIKI